MPVVYDILHTRGCDNIIIDFVKIHDAQLDIFL